ncbi:MAG: flippase [Candidatus Thermoplasmatota archaeon]
MIARKSTIIMFSDLTDALLAYVAIFFIARYMHPSDYGIIGFAMGYIGLFTIVNSLGFDEAHIKRVSEGKQDLGTCIGTFLVTKLGLVSFMAALTVGSIFFWKFIAGRGFETPEHELAVYIILLYFIFERVATIFQTTYTGETKIAKTYIPKLLSTVLRTVGIIFVALEAQAFDFGAIELAWAYVFGHLFLLISSIILFRKYPIKKPTLACFKSYSQFAFPLIIVSAAAAIMNNVDKVLIQLFWSAEDVGYYYACSRISGFIVVAAAGLGTILFPTIAYHHEKNDAEGIRQIMHQAERYISMFTFPLVVGLVVLAEPAIHILLSDKYYPAIPVFRILPFFSFFYALTIPYNSQLLGMNKPHLVRNRIIVMFIINLVLNIILIPKDIQSLGITCAGLGMVGAALSLMISYFIGLIYYIISAYKLIGLKFNLRIVLHGGAAGIMGAVLWWISASNVIIIDKWYELLAVGLLGSGVYLGILAILKEFTKKDLIFILDTLNIKKMLSYIKKEIRRD